MIKKNYTLFIFIPEKKNKKFLKLKEPSLVEELSLLQHTSQNLKRVLGSKGVIGGFSP